MHNKLFPFISKLQLDWSLFLPDHLLIIKALKARKYSKANDEATMELITHFYQNLSEPGITKAEALKKAQIALLKHESNNWKRPYIWAPYILIGNWL